MTKMIVITAIPQCTNAGGIVPMMLRTFSERSSIRFFYLIRYYYYFLFPCQLPNSNWFFTKLKYAPCFSMREAWFPVSTTLPLSSTIIWSAFFTVESR